MLAWRFRQCIRSSLYFLCWWVIPIGVHLSDCCTIAALSQCVMFSNRFVKWMEAEDGTNNDALCLPAICYINVPLITACVCVWVKPKGYWWSCALLLYRHSHLWACTGCVSIQRVDQILCEPKCFHQLGENDKKLTPWMLYMENFWKSWWPDFCSPKALHNH